MGRIKTSKKDRVWQPLYDTAQVALGAGVAGAQFVMFQNPVGVAAQNLLLTNMRSSGSMPVGESFKCFGVTATPMNLDGALITPLTDYSDWVNFSTVSILEITSINKVVFRLPLHKITAGCGTIGASAGAGTAITTIWANGIPDPRAVYTFKPERIVFNPLEPFNVTITTVNAYAVALVAAVNCLITLDGLLYRNIQ